MTSKTKKLLILTGAGLLATGLFLAYRQYKKIMSYTIKVAGKKILKLSSNEIVFDLYVAFTNFAKVPIVVKSQSYDVYVNTSFVSKVESFKETTIKANTTTTFPLRISVNPKDVFKALGTNWANLLLQPEKLIITTIFEVRVSLWGFGIPIKNSFSITLAEILKSQKEQVK